MSCFFVSNKKLREILASHRRVMLCRVRLNYAE